VKVYNVYISVGDRVTRRMKNKFGHSRKVAQKSKKKAKTSSSKVQRKVQIFY
jgi:hypothetical protein